MPEDYRCRPLCRRNRRALSCPGRTSSTCLYAFSLLTGILGAAATVDSKCFPYRVALAPLRSLLNYLKRSEARGTWLESHFLSADQDVLQMAFVGIVLRHSSSSAYARHRHLVAWLPLGIITILVHLSDRTRLDRVERRPSDVQYDSDRSRKARPVLATKPPPTPGAGRGPRARASRRRLRHRPPRLRRKAAFLQLPAHPRPRARRRGLDPATSRRAQARRPLLGRALPQLRAVHRLPRRTINCCAELRCSACTSTAACGRDRRPGAQAPPLATLAYDQLALVETLGDRRPRRRARGHQRDDFVLVIGAGPIGLSVCQFVQVRARHSRSWTCGSRASNSAGAQLGVKHTLIDRAGCRRTASQHRGGDLPTVVIDATGNAASMAGAFDLPGAGRPHRLRRACFRATSFNDPNFHRRELTVLASRNALPGNFREIIALIEAGRIDTTPGSRTASPSSILRSGFLRSQRPPA